MTKARGDWLQIDGGWLMLETCFVCKTPFAMSQQLYETAQARKEGMTFYCPNGHSQHYVTGESETVKLRRERDRLTQRLAEKDDDIRYQRDRAEALERRVSAARGQITKIKKRAANGVCPCCNRTFSDLARHMAGKHPGFVKEPDATEAITVN